MEALDKKITLVCWLIRAFTNNFYRLGILITAAVAIFVYGFNIDENSEITELVLCLNILSGTIAVISLSISIWAGLFTYKHFEEVWSRRMKWNNSNVDKMEARFNYSFKIFYRMFFTLFATIFIILWGITIGISFLMEK